MLPKNKARKIRVDGVAYCWGVSEARTGKSALFVMRADGTGPRLEVTLIWELEGFYWTPLQDLGCGPMPPRIVAQLMTGAREAGWLPNAPGPTFVLAK